MSRSLRGRALLVALAATVAGCESDPGAQVVQRDVYVGPDALERCMADWGSQELCQKQLDDAEKKKLAEAAHSGGGGGAMPIFVNTFGGGYQPALYGPAYASGNRSVVHNGKPVVPVKNGGIRTAMFSGVNPASQPLRFGAPKQPSPAAWAQRAFAKQPPVSVPSPARSVSVSRGGFGSTGAGISSGG